MSQVKERVLDPLTASGFAQIADAFGVEQAHDCKIAAIKRGYRENSWFRWHGEKWRKALETAVFRKHWGDDGAHYIAADCFAEYTRHLDDILVRED